MILAIFSVWRERSHVVSRTNDSFVGRCRSRVLRVYEYSCSCAQCTYVRTRCLVSSRLVSPRGLARKKRNTLKKKGMTSHTRGGGTRRVPPEPWTGYRGARDRGRRKGTTIASRATVDIGWRAGGCRQGAGAEVSASKGASERTGSQSVRERAGE